MCKEKTTVVLVDDHILIRRGMAELINKFDDFTVIWEASNGKEFIQNMKQCPVPEIVLLDIAMPELDGYETALWLKRKHPLIKIVVLSMFVEEKTIIKMIRTGIDGYILKDAEPEELKFALNEIKSKRHYYSDVAIDAMTDTIKKPEDENKEKIKLSVSEITFLKLVCTEMTYKEIADKMCISLRAVDSTRDRLFEKLNVKNRIGLVIYAIKNEIVNLDDL